MDAATHTLAAHGARVRIKAAGAELASYISPAGTELIWQAHAAWPRHAPNLFPIVGTVREDQYRHRGQRYRLGRHGFARDSLFTWAERTPTTARLVLADSAATRAVYPFAFRFEVAYALGAEGLAIRFTLHNTGAEMLPAAMGAHPAFNWPLHQGVAKDAHRLIFSDAEPAPIRRVGADGLLRPDPLPSPIQDRVLPLNEAVFAEDAVILDRLASRALRYAAPGGESVEVAWQGFPHLGIWSRPGVDLLCIEPWHGFSDPAGFTGEISEKPGIMHLSPGEERTATHWIRPLPA